MKKRRPHGYIAPTSLPFRKGSMTWQVNMEPVIGLGGGRALLLQTLHPLVAAGVEQHSNYAEDPFRRGFRTADIMLKLAFGEPDVSRRQEFVLRRIHEHVKGTSPDGVPYDAMDPKLLMWVWATLVDVSLLVYERAVRRLSDLDKQRWYEEQKLVAYACGIPRGGCPETLDDFRAYFERMLRTELRVTRTARVVAYAGRNPPLPWRTGRFAGAVGTFFTAGLLPDELREPLGYRWTRTHELMLRAYFVCARVATRLVPRPVRHLQNRWLIGRRKPLGLWKNRPVQLPDELRAAG